MNDVTKIKFQVIKNWNKKDQMKPGQALVFEYPDKTLGLVLCCPACGKSSSSKTGGHKYNPETKSVTPSIVHDKDLGGCGWHGFLTNGKFLNA